MRTPSAPAWWPDLLPELVDDVGGRERAAAYLGVTVRQVDAWTRAPGRAPRAVWWALLYESPRGRALLDIDSANERTALRGLVAALEREALQLRAALRTAEARPDAYGAANAATFDSRTRPARLPAARPSARESATPPQPQWQRPPGRRALRAALRARWG